ncbi:MAG: sugar phosphate isomerase/epimerase [Sedimentisphaerales bacterium]|nr:sugar phosphate isomerase/epimerase [Sedimentisphaerales bacterium]
MKDEYINHNCLTRRNFLGGAATLAAFTIAPNYLLGNSGEQKKNKPNSVFDGVRIGVITYSYRGVESTAEGTLAAIVKCGLSEVELMSDPVNNYVGLGGGSGGFGIGMMRGGRGGTRGETPQEVQESEKSQTRSILDVPILKFEELQKMYNDAGVNIHIVKFDSVARETSEDVINKYFEAAKALGANAVTMERSEEAAKKLAPYAEKHEIWIAFHNHTNNYPRMDKEDDPILSYGKYIGFNFDTGHYFAGSGGKSPIPVIERYHERIVSLHLKDRTAEGGNLPWGQGNTPIKEILHLMREKKWKFPADIELEYRVPEGSDAVTEVTKCVQYCRDALAS